MGREEFERELNHYLAQRKKAKFSLPKFFQPKKKVESRLPPEVQKYDEQTPAEVPETMPGDDSHPEPGQQGFMGKFLQKIGLLAVEKSPEELSQEHVQEMLTNNESNQDMKDVAKIALKAIKHLPPEQLSTFKQSNEFSRLKAILKKYQLIK